ncbi:MAG TPA: bacteriohemerythrin [Opitutales bacterium]|nr:bacteriohemerythrin [Opitutales bacterium]
MVTFFPWKASYSVGIASIDAQHMKLVELLNSLWDAMSHGQGNEACGKILNQLVSYTLSHFETEEYLLRKHNYADYAAHKKEHDILKERIRVLQDDLRTGKARLSVELGDFLKEWLRHHILETDMKYAKHLQSKGVK